MRIYLLACLLLLGGLQLSSCQEDVDEEDGFVEEADDEEPEPPKERVYYQRPVPRGSTFFVEPFDTRAEFLKKWVQSQAKKDGAEDNIAKYDGRWTIEEPHESPLVNDLSLILKSKAKHSAIAAKLDKPFQFTDKPFIAQYEVRFQSGIDCGGAYVKLLTKEDGLNLKKFTDKTPYTIMFGPDKCGNDYKLHFIFRHKNPINGEFEEKHAAKPSGKIDSYFTDKKTHLYTLVIQPDNTYQVKIDNSVVMAGSLLENMSPPVNPPKEIEDPDDKKPVDWDDREKISDPDAVKPEDWDESAPPTIVDETAVKPSGWLDDEEDTIPDPSAVQPEDWDDEMDGEWEAPRIDNPKCASAAGCGKWQQPTIQNPAYKGKWKPPMIDNPDYKGEWKPKIIENPNYFEDKHPFKMSAISALGLELWSMTSDIAFDNFIISDNETVVDDFTTITWELKNRQEGAASSGGWWKTIKSSADERPWLWGVYAVVLLLPIVLLSICLCPKAGPVKPEDIAAHKKKFDDPTPDSIPEEEEENKADEHEGAQGDTIKEEEEEEAEEEAPAAGGDAPETGGGDTGEKADGEEEEEKPVEGSPKQTTNSPRKRRTRKE